MRVFCELFPEVMFLLRCRGDVELMSIGWLLASRDTLPRLHGVGIATECARDVGDRTLSAHAVAGFVERRRDHRHSPVAWRHGDQSATDTAFCGQPRPKQPLS